MTKSVEEYADIRKYLPALVAAEFVGQKNFRAARKCLEAIAVEGEDAKLVQTALLKEKYSGSEESQADVENATILYATIYQEKLSSRKLKEFSDIFSKEFSHFFKDEERTKKAKKILESADIDYKTFMEDFTRSNTIKEKPHGFSKDEVKKAKDFIRKNSGLMRILHNLQDYASRDINDSANYKAQEEEMHQIADSYEE